MGRSGSSSRRKRSKKKSLKVSSEGYRKKKSRRNKSKRLRCQDDSFSSSPDDESTSSSLNSYSCSEGEYKRKRARSRSRSEIKGSKKRRRRRSLSEDSGEYSSPVKKRKRSKKSKKIKKKKSRGDAYVSSASSDSGSCSTCKYEDSSSDELGSHRRSRGRSREKKKDHRDSTKGRIENRKNRSKSRSSLSPGSSYGDESIEKVAVENNPMRLKSVITVANLEHEEENMKNNKVKEEMVYDYDDYPSSKSNDSIEAVDRFNMSSYKKDVVKEVNSGSNLDDNKDKESNVSGNIGLEADNLESILRQKALENLSRFRGGIKTKPEIPVDENPKSDQTGVKQLKHETVSTIPVSQPVINRSRFTWRRDPSVTTAKDEKVATYSEQHPSGSQPAEPKLHSANPSSTSRVDNKFVNETSKITANTNKVDQKSIAVDETPSCSIKEGSSKEQQNESNDNSQFEKKTMSVMRGGEMVQVSYKVYIPNRAPALARRQLKR